MVYRHPTNKSLGGVCAGLADFVGWDPVVMRGIWVVATFVTSGAGFMVYLLLWLLLPVGTQATGQVRPAAIQFSNLGGSRVATVLLALGGIWMLSNLGILPALADTAGVFLRIFFWPLLLIGIGYMLLRGRGDTLRSHFSDLHAKVGGRVRAAGDAQSRMPVRRSRSNRMVLGLCGGLGERLGIDANLIRLAWAIFIFGTMGMGLIAYFVIALFVPEEGSHWVADAGSHWAPAMDADAAQDVPVVRAQNGPQPVGPVQAVWTVEPVAQPAAPAPQNDVSPIGSEIVQF